MENSVVNGSSAPTMPGKVPGREDITTEIRKVQRSGIPRKIQDRKVFNKIDIAVNVVSSMSNIERVTPSATDSLVSSDKSESTSPLESKEDILSCSASKIPSPEQSQMKLLKNNPQKVSESNMTPRKEETGSVVTPNHNEDRQDCSTSKIPGVKGSVKRLASQAGLTETVACKRPYLMSAHTRALSGEEMKSLISMSPRESDGSKDVEVRPVCPEISNARKETMASIASETSVSKPVRSDSCVAALIQPSEQENVTNLGFHKLLRSPELFRSPRGKSAAVIKNSPSSEKSVSGNCRKTSSAISTSCERMKSKIPSSISLRALAKPKPKSPVQSELAGHALETEGATDKAELEASKSVKTNLQKPKNVKGTKTSLAKTAGIKPEQGQNPTKEAPVCEEQKIVLKAKAEEDSLKTSDEKSKNVDSISSFTNDSFSTPFTSTETSDPSVGPRTESSSDLNDREIFSSSTILSDTLSNHSPELRKLSNQSLERVRSDDGASLARDKDRWPLPLKSTSRSLENSKKQNHSASSLKAKTEQRAVKIFQGNFGKVVVKNTITKASPGPSLKIGCTLTVKNGSVAKNLSNLSTESTMEYTKSLAEQNDDTVIDTDRTVILEENTGGNLTPTVEPALTTKEELPEPDEKQTPDPIPQETSKTSISKESPSKVEPKCKVSVAKVSSETKMTGSKSSIQSTRSWAPKNSKSPKVSPKNKNSLTKTDDKQGNDIIAIKSPQPPKSPEPQLSPPLDKTEDKSPEDRKSDAQSPGDENKNILGNISEEAEDQPQNVDKSKGDASISNTKASSEGLKGQNLAKTLDKTVGDGKKSPSQVGGKAVDLKNPNKVGPKVLQRSALLTQRASTSKVPAVIPRSLINSTKKIFESESAAKQTPVKTNTTKAGTVTPKTTVKPAMGKTVPKKPPAKPTGTQSRNLGAKESVSKETPPLLSSRSDSRSNKSIKSPTEASCRRALKTPTKAAMMNKTSLVRMAIAQREKSNTTIASTKGSPLIATARTSTETHNDSKTKDSQASSSTLFLKTPEKSPSSVTGFLSHRNRTSNSLKLVEPKKRFMFGNAGKPVTGKSNEKDSQGNAINARERYVTNNKIKVFENLEKQLQILQTEFLSKYESLRKSSNEKLKNSYKMVTLVQGDDLKLIVSKDDLIRIPKNPPIDAINEFKDKIKITMDKNLNNFIDKLMVLSDVPTDSDDRENYVKELKDEMQKLTVLHLDGLCQEIDILIEPKVNNDELIKGLEQELSETKEKSLALESQIVETEERHRIDKEALKIALTAQSHAEISQLEMQLEDLIAKVDFLETNSCEDEKDDKTDEIATLEAKNAALKSHINQMSDCLSKAELEKTKIKDANKLIVEKWKEMEVSYANALREIFGYKQMIKKHKELDDKYAEEVRKSTEEISNLRQELTVCYKDLARMQEKLTAAEIDNARFEALMRDNELAENRIRELLDKIKSLRNEDIEALKNENSELKEMVETLRFSEKQKQDVIAEMKLSMCKEIKIREHIEDILQRKEDEMNSQLNLIAELQQNEERAMKQCQELRNEIQKNKETQVQQCSELKNHTQELKILQRGFRDKVTELNDQCHLIEALQNSNERHQLLRVRNEEKIALLEAEKRHLKDTINIYTSQQTTEPHQILSNARKFFPKSLFATKPIVPPGKAIGVQTIESSLTLLSLFESVPAPTPITKEPETITPNQTSLDTIKSDEDEELALQEAFHRDYEHRRRRRDRHIIVKKYDR